jgi:hypothetical protein
MGRKLTAAQHRRAARLFELAATRVDQSLGKRVKDVSALRTLKAEERARYEQSFNDGDCEYTLELTAVRP